MIRTLASPIRLLLVLGLCLPAFAFGVGSGPRLNAARAQGADCATDAPSAASSPAANVAEAASPAAGAAGAGANGAHVAFLPKDVVNPYFASNFRGAEEAAGELGGTAEQVGPDTPNAAEQVTFIQTLTQQGVAAIGVSANDPNALAPALNEARSQGIKVVSFDSDVAPDARDLYVNPANSEDIGRDQIRDIARLIGCEGEIAILSAASTATNQNAWIEFMQDELTRPGYENIELVEVAYGDDEDGKSYDKTIELLTAYPDLKGIVSPTTVGIKNAAAALRDEGRTDVALTGLGLPNEMREFIKDGTVQEFALWNPTDLYYLTYYAAIALVNGEITGAPGDTFTAGRLGSYTVGEGGVVLLGPPFAFTAENIDDFDF
jgi:rhamnose transport system substrate-binding protein